MQSEVNRNGEGKQEITKSKCSKELKKRKKEKEKRVDLFREIRATTGKAVIPGFFRLIQHSVALQPKEEKKKERGRERERDKNGTA